MRLAWSGDEVVDFGGFVAPSSELAHLREAACGGPVVLLAGLGSARGSKPGAAGGQRDYELEAGKAEVARLSEACKELAVKLTLVEGTDGWGGCPSSLSPLLPETKSLGAGGQEDTIVGIALDLVGAGAPRALLAGGGSPQCGPRRSRKL